MQPQIAVRPNWWSRNWKWVVPVGGVALIGATVALFAMIVMLVFGIIKQSDVYKDAMFAAQNNAVLQSEIGTPIEADFLVNGNIQVSGSSGSADIAFGVSGPRGRATIYAVADRSARVWHYQTLEAELEATGDVIDLR